MKKANRVRFSSVLVVALIAGAIAASPLAAEPQGAERLVSPAGSALSTIRGTVLDDFTGKPVPNFSVKLSAGRCKNTSPSSVFYEYTRCQEVVITDSAGRFQFQPVGADAQSRPQAPATASYGIRAGHGSNLWGLISGTEPPLPFDLLAGAGVYGSVAAGGIADRTIRVPYFVQFRSRVYIPEGKLIENRQCPNGGWDFYQLDGEQAFRADYYKDGLSGIHPDDGPMYTLAMHGTYKAKMRCRGYPDTWIGGASFSSATAVTLAPGEFADLGSLTMLKNSPKPKRVCKKIKATYKHKRKTARASVRVCHKGPWTKKDQKKGKKAARKAAKKKWVKRYR